MRDPFRISFVCTGNICRSPMGAVIFAQLAKEAGLGDLFEVTSRGTGPWHIGDQADHRTLTALATAGYEGGAHRAAQIDDDDIRGNDLLVALARDHERAILDLGGAAERVTLLTPFDPEAPADPDVFDPYFSDQPAFDAVLRQVERSCERLLAHLCEQLDATPGAR